MTDVLIRGMKVPEHCNAKFPFYCVGMGRGYYDCDITKKSYSRDLDGRPPDCPINVLPKHGELKDARQIREQIDDIWDGRPLLPVGAKVLAIIDSAPVVVPASEEESP